MSDAGSVFNAEEFRDVCFEHGITLRSSGIESLNSIGICERFHHPLRQDYTKLRGEYPTMPVDVVLQCAVHALNSTMGPEGLVPCLLVFGALPRIPHVNPTHPVSTRRRFTLMRTAREEYTRIVAKSRVAAGLNHQPPASADEVYEPGDSLYEHREKLKSWSGPHLVVSVKDKEVVFDIEGRHAGYNCAKVKRAFVPLPIRWTEVLEPGDARIESVQMSDAVKAELDGLFKRGTFKNVVLPDPSSENVLPTKFFYSIKHEDSREIYKARFVIGGHRDKRKNHVIHTASSLSHTSFRLLLAIASIFWLGRVVRRCAASISSER
jgi:hypothetical protein